MVNSNLNSFRHVYASDSAEFAPLLASADPVTAKKRHALSACLIVHPKGDRFGEMATRLVEWIEYGLIMGFEHFYVYDHMHGRPQGDKAVWDAVFHYIKHHGRVTYLEWPFPYLEPWIFQLCSCVCNVSAMVFGCFCDLCVFRYSFINSCLNRFKYDNDYMAVLDVDEYLVPPRQFVTVLDVLRHMNAQAQRHIPMFVLKCKLATTCPERLGCGEGVAFHSFLERHGCVSDDNPPTNPKKYIVNPMAMWYAFVHGVPRWKEGVDNVAGVFTELGLCLHARDHHKAHSFYHNASVDHVIAYLHYSWKHDTAIHPLFDKDREYCPD